MTLLEWLYYNTRWRKKMGNFKVTVKKSMKTELHDINKKDVYKMLAIQMYGFL